jgi:cell division protein FtsB
MSQAARGAGPGPAGRAPGDEPSVRPSLQVIRRRSRALIKRGPARRLAPAAILAAICVGGVVLAILLEQVMLAQSAFELTRLRRGLVNAQSRHETLLLEAAELDSPSRIESYARDALGMVEPGDQDYVVADIPLGSSGGRLAARRIRSGAPAGEIAGGAPPPLGPAATGGARPQDFLPSAVGTSDGG